MQAAFCRVLSSRATFQKCCNSTFSERTLFAFSQHALSERSPKNEQAVLRSSCRIHHQLSPASPFQKLQGAERGFKTSRGCRKASKRVQKAAKRLGVYAKGSEFRYFATCTPGLENIVADELVSPLIDAQNVSAAKAGVAFTGDKAVGYRANLWLRCAVRVLVQMAEGELATWRPAGDEVYSFIKGAVDWRALLLVEGRRSYEPPLLRTFWVDTRVWDCTNVTHSGMVATRAKDAICDAIRDSCQGVKPPMPEHGAADADVPLFLTLYRDRVTVYRDMSGVSLHKRGYRDAMHRASLNEGVAAGMLKLAGFGRGGFKNSIAAPSRVGSNRQARSLEEQFPEFVQTDISETSDDENLSQGSHREEGGRFRMESHREAESSGRDDTGAQQILLDPMCGSGTILIEAALMATNKAPGLLRKRWPFQSWPDFDELLWKRCMRGAKSCKTNWPEGLRIIGNDIHPGALDLCRRDAAAAGVLDVLTLSQEDCADYVPPAKPTHIVVNPPWGLRLDSMDRDAQEEEHYMLISAYSKLGGFLKDQCGGADVFLLSGNADVTKNMRLKADRKWPLSVGGIDCRVLHYKVLPPLSEKRKLEIGEDKRKAVEDGGLSRREFEGREKKVSRPGGSRYGVFEEKQLAGRSERVKGRRTASSEGRVKFDPRDDVDSERAVRKGEPSKSRDESQPAESVWT